MTFERLLDISDDLEQFVKEARDSLAIRIDARVVKETPVDTGAARRSWLVSFSRPDDTQPGPGKDFGAAVERAKSAIQSAPAYGQLYIQNNVPYIEYLNEGSSDNRPLRYVDVAIEQEVARGN